MNAFLEIIGDPVVTGILTVVGAIASLGEILNWWDFGPIRIWKWAIGKVHQTFLRVPKETLKVIPMNPPQFTWNMGTIDGKPAMQVVKDFYFTNLTTEPALVVGTYFVAQCWKWKVFPRRIRVNGHVCVKDDASQYHGRYAILPRATTIGRADWWIEPPILKAGESLHGKACFIDRFGNEHWTPKLTWESHSR
jgi:hypothetical protein